jgi:hypothetical protein
MSTAPNLRLVREPPQEPRPAADAGPALSDVALLAVLFLLNLIPVVGELAGLGRWSPAIVGFGAGAALLTGRELWSELRARARARR